MLIVPSSFRIIVYTNKQFWLKDFLFLDARESRAITSRDINIKYFNICKSKILLSLSENIWKEEVLYRDREPF